MNSGGGSFLQLPSLPTGTGTPSTRLASELLLEEYMLGRRRQVTMRA